MTDIVLITAAAMVAASTAGVIYHVVIAPRKWMKLHGDGIYDAKYRFNKANLGVKK